MWYSAGLILKIETETINNPVKSFNEKKNNNNNNQYNFLIFQIPCQQQSTQRFPNSNNFDLSKTILMFAVQKLLHDKLFNK